MMASTPKPHNRRSIRLQGYDYSQPGAYFVTLCVQDHHCLFGHIEDSVMVHNAIGTIVTDAWEWLARQYDHVDLDAFVIMPNHMHGIIVLSELGRGGSRTAPTIIHRKNTPDGKITHPQRKPLGRLIGSCKTISTKRINMFRQTPGTSVWQRNYWEHVIRNGRTLDAARQYITQNPLHWELDRCNTNPKHADPWRKSSAREPKF